MQAQLTPDPEQAIRILEQLKRNLGDSVTLRVTFADQIVKAGGPEMAERLKALEEQSSSFSDEDQNETLARAGDGLSARRALGRGDSRVAGIASAE